MLNTEFYQLNIYEVTSLLEDPIYKQLENLNINDDILLENIMVRRTQRFYEIENDEIHEGFIELEKCYQFINSLLTDN